MESDETGEKTEDVGIDVHPILFIIKKMRNLFYMIYIAITVLLIYSVATSDISILLGEVNISHKEIKYVNAQVRGRPETKTILINLKGGREMYSIGCGRKFKTLCEQYYNKHIEIFDLRLVVINNSAIGVLGFRTKSGLEFKFDEETVIQSRIETEKMYSRFFFMTFLILTPIFFLSLFLTYLFNRKIRSKRRSALRADIYI